VTTARPPFVSSAPLLRKDASSSVDVSNNSLIFASVAGTLFLYLLGTALLASLFNRSNTLSSSSMATRAVPAFEATRRVAWPAALKAYSESLNLAASVRFAGLWAVRRVCDCNDSSENNLPP
jgi:hypothetical protein